MGPPPVALGATLVALSVVLIAAALGARRLRTRPRAERVAAFCLPLFFFAVVWISAGLLIEAPWHSWIASRLSVSATLLEGYELYRGLGEGPLNGWVYPPPFVLFFLPVMLVRDLTAAIYLGSVLNMAWGLVPLFVLTRRSGGAGLTGAALFALAWAGLLISQPTRQILGGVHVDAMTVGLGLLSCSFLIGDGAAGTGSPQRRRLLAAAVLAVASCWTKQVEAPLILVQLAYLGLVRGRRAFLTYFAYASLATLLLGGLFALAFGARDMFFNILVVPSSHPYYPFAPVLREMLRVHAPWAVLIALSGVLLARRRECAWLDEPYVLPLLVSMFMLPITFFARAKYGGSINSYHALPYLIAACALALLRLVQGLGMRARWSLIGALGLAALPLLSFQRARQAYLLLDEIAENPQAKAYRFARAHPEEVYYPWFPLVTLRADGKLYHFECGVHDRKLAGYEIDDEQVRAGLPARLRYVVYEPGSVQEMLEHLPEFSRRTELAELPGWSAYMR